MRTTILLALALLLAPLTALAAGPKEIDKDTALKAIDRFMADPKMGEDAAIIARFTEESELVLVNIDPRVITWETHEPAYKEAPLLLTAFLAGNDKSQLDSGKAEDDSYGGLLAVFKVYDMLKAKDSNLKIPEVEELLAMEKKGELKDFVAKASKDR